MAPDDVMARIEVGCDDVRLSRAIAAARAQIMVMVSREILTVKQTLSGEVGWRGGAQNDHVVAP